MKDHVSHLLEFHELPSDGEHWSMRVIGTALVEEVVDGLQIVQDQDIISQDSQPNKMALREYQPVQLQLLVLVLTVL